MHVLLCVLSLAAASQAVMIQQPGSTTLDTLNTHGHHTLVQLIKLANLTSLFDGTSTDQYTIFAPYERTLAADLRQMNQTVQSLSQNITLLTEILAYHVIPGVHPKSDLFNERKFTTLQGSAIRCNQYYHTGYRYIDGNRISATSYQTQNGIIHTTQHLLSPKLGSIYAMIAADPQLSTLKAAVDTAGLDAFLSDTEPITLFAPTNQAFNLLGATVNTLLAKPTVLADILKYHVVYGTLYSGGMHDEALHTFEEADKLTLDVQRNQAVVDGTRLNEWDISATNGVIHKIGQVLVPADLKNQI